MIPSYGSVGSYRHRGGRCNASIPRLAEFFCEKNSKKLSKIVLKTLLYSTLRKKYFWKYFDLKDSICKITLKTNELSIPDIRARTRIIIHILQKMR